MRSTGVPLLLLLLLSSGALTYSWHVAEEAHALAAESETGNATIKTADVLALRLSRGNGQTRRRHYSRQSVLCLEGTHTHVP